MSTHSKAGNHRGVIAAVVTAVLLFSGAGLVFAATRGPDSPPQPPAAAAQDPILTNTPTDPPSSAPTQTAPGADFGPLLAASAPVALRIPSIGVSTKGIVDLNLDSKGKLEAPKDFDKAGWYAGGPTPGELGPSVIGAHVDSKAGPAVFYRLGSLKKGAEVSVTRKDGSAARFVVDQVARYSKDDFPTATVYGDTRGRAELRLITCGGAFDQATGHYVDNIVAFAHLVD